jgi:hypothetical protein
MVKFYGRKANVRPLIIKTFLTYSIIILEKIPRIGYELYLHKNSHTITEENFGNNVTPARVKNINKNMK